MTLPKHTSGVGFPDLKQYPKLKGLLSVADATAQAEFRTYICDVYRSALEKQLALLQARIDELDE